MQVEADQNSGCWLLSATSLILATCTLFACSGGGSDGGGGNAGVGGGGSSGGGGKDTGNNEEPPPPALATFTSSSDVVTAAADLLRLRQLTEVDLATAGSGVGVAAVVRNLPDLAAGELQPKAALNHIELRDSSGNPIAQSDTERYLSALDLGRFGDGSVIAHILAGQSTGAATAIPGIGQGMDDLDIYPLNYLADPDRTTTDYDDPTDFLTAQNTATATLEYLTAPAAPESSNSNRQIVLFSNPITLVGLLPSQTCVSSDRQKVLRGQDTVAAIDSCIRRGVEGNVGTNLFRLPGPLINASGWFYSHAAALNSGNKPNAPTFPTIAVPAGDLFLSYSLFVPTDQPEEQDTAGGYLTYAFSVSEQTSTGINQDLETTFGAQDAAGHNTTPYTGPTNFYARLPGLTGTITRDFGQPATFTANYSHMLVVVGVQVGGSDNGVIHAASSRCGGGQKLADPESPDLTPADRIQLACIAAPGNYEAVRAAAGRPRVIGASSTALLVAADPFRQASLGITDDDIATTNTGAYGQNSQFGRITLSYSDQIYVRAAADKPIARDEDGNIVNFAASLAITEVAAAIATASLALVTERFSDDTGMSNAQILQRLKDTANKTGRYARADIYGNGLIDLDAALTPSGKSTLPLTGRAAGLSVPLQTGALQQLSAAFGDALSTGLGTRRYIALDSLHAPFAYSAANLLSRTETPITASIEPLGRHRQNLGNISDTAWTLQTRYSLSDPSRTAMSWQTHNIALSVSQNISPGLLTGIAAQSLLAAAPLQSDSALYAPWASQNLHWQTAATRITLGSTQISLTQFAARSPLSERSEQSHSAPKQSGHIANISTQWGKTAWALSCWTAPVLMNCWGCPVACALATPKCRR